MRFKKNPSRIPHLNEVLSQQSLAPCSSKAEPFSLNLVNDKSKLIKKPKKPTTALSNVKLQKKLKIQKYRDKLSSDPRQNDQTLLDEDDTRLIDFLRKYNEFMEKQNSQKHSSTIDQQERPLRHPSPVCQEKKSYKKPKLTKLERLMKDLECTMVQGNGVKPQQVAAARRGILKSKKINMLRNYRQQKQHNNGDEMMDVYVDLGNYVDSESYAIKSKSSTPVDNSLEEFKLKLINAVIEKDALEESTLSKTNPSVSKEEDTPISVLIKSNELQMMKSNSMEMKDDEMESQHNGVTNGEDEIREEEFVDEKVRKKIEKQLNIDVTDKYNFVKQTARTKLRPKSTPDFEMNKRFRKNRYRVARSIKLKKTNLLSENTCGQNHFLGFDKSIKRFKDEMAGEGSSAPSSLVNRSYFNWDEFTVPTRVNKFQVTPTQDIASVAFRDEMDFLMYCLVNKKAKSTFDWRLERRLEMWMKICKTRKDLQVKLFQEKFYLIENEGCKLEQHCDILNCDKNNMMLAVPTSSSPCYYLDISDESINNWNNKLNRSKLTHTEESKQAKTDNRELIKQMILQKQLRCNSTYAAYDISDQNATNLYQDESQTLEKQRFVNTGVDESLISCKTSRISYCTSGNYINVSVNLQSPMKRRASEIDSENGTLTDSENHSILVNLQSPMKRRASEIDSENQSLASSCEQLPRAHIAKIEELFTDEVSLSNEHETSCSSDETRVCDSTTDTKLESDCTESTETPSEIPIADDHPITPRIRSSFNSHLLVDNKSEHNGLISSFLDYGNGQNTRRKKKRPTVKKKANKSEKCSRGRKFDALRKPITDKRTNNSHRKLLKGRRKFSVREKVHSRQNRLRRNTTSLDSSTESNSNSYESMYDIVKTKTRHSLSKSIFNFENCKFPRKDGDVFFTTLTLNSSESPVLALMKSKQSLPDYLSRYTVMSEHQTPRFRNAPKLSMKIAKFTKLQIFVIYLKNIYFLFFKN
uniref:Uncharacterized protein n=1 Tax=Cacopsylla melanoneura TaxID=428564 RepID=A0A8D8VWX4_9HEMI